MPLVYLPQFVKEVDYKLLCWLDQHEGKSGISFEILDELNFTIKGLEQSFKRLEKEGFARLKCDGSAIIGIELTQKAQAFLAEHIIRKIRTKKG